MCLVARFGVGIRRELDDLGDFLLGWGSAGLLYLRFNVLVG